MEIKSEKRFNLTLSGGGIKGIAFVGSFDAAEKKGIEWNNIAGVSAGALAGSYLAAGYNADSLFHIMQEFDFEKIEIDKIRNNIPVVARYMDFIRFSRRGDYDYLEEFLSMERGDDIAYGYGYPMNTDRGGLIKNIATYSKEGCLYDGDLLEEWVSKTLSYRGVKTFGDLKTGTCDNVNPGGYKIRMTAVDITQPTKAKLVVLPDDMGLYGLDPDKFEVAKAVRMSTSVPFAFKPVEIRVGSGLKAKTYSFVDGGVFDNFPFWLVDSQNEFPTIGFRFAWKKKPISFDTPLDILKKMLSLTHNIGVPKGLQLNPQCVANIETSTISFLDFALDPEKIEFLVDRGKQAANSLFMGLFGMQYKTRWAMENLLRYKTYPALISG